MLSFHSMFWLGLSIAFFVMAARTYWTRKVLVPNVLNESRGAIILGVSVGDERKLKRIFDETLTIEILAFILTGIAAFHDFLFQ